MWFVLAYSACSPPEAAPPGATPHRTFAPPDTGTAAAPTTAAGCGVRTLDWVNGLDDDGDGAVDLMRVLPGGWTLPMPIPDYPNLYFAGSSVGLDVDGNGAVAWFATVEVDTFPAIPEMDGALVRLDGDRCAPTGRLDRASVFALASGIDRVERFNDVTGDGVPEFVVAIGHENYYWPSSSPLSVLLVDPTAVVDTLAQGTLATIAAEDGTAMGPTGDFDGDGRLELTLNVGTAWLLIEEVPVGASTVDDLPAASILMDLETSYTHSLVRANLDGDASDDLVLLGADVYLAHGGPDLDGLALGEDIPATFHGYGQTLVGDVNGDGVDDIVRALEGDSAHGVEWWEGGPTASFDGPADGTVSFPAEWTPYAIGDIDGGGAADLLISDWRRDDLYRVARGEGDFATIDLRIQYDGGYATHRPKLADIDGDGRMEVISPGHPTADGRDGTFPILWGQPAP